MSSGIKIGYLENWWDSVDRLTFICVCSLIFLGIMVLFSVAPAAAFRFSLSNDFHFLYRQLMLLPLVLTIIFISSLLNPLGIRRLSFFLLLIFLFLLFSTLFSAETINGAKRWVRFFGVSVQPVEFIKPVFAVAEAYFLSYFFIYRDKRYLFLSFGLWFILCFLVIAQPDLGQVIILSVIFGSQIFLLGLTPLIWFVFLLFILLILLFSYFYYPHISHRIETFLDPSSGDGYQVVKALESFYQGNLFGRGSGEGTIKYQLPDAHSDFIFASMAEEFGVILCLLVLFCFVVIGLSIYLRLRYEQDIMVLLAAGGLSIGFLSQALTNILSNINLIPVKGITLPFISYGGSSLLASSLTIGFLLSLTKRKAFIS